MELVFTVVGYASTLLVFSYMVAKIVELIIRKVKVKPEPEPEKLPHEIFPELLHWQINDRVITNYKEGRRPDDYYNKEGKFLGILDNKIHVQFVRANELESFSPAYTKGYFRNSSARERFCEFEAKRIAKSISEDSYNQFLVVLKEENQKLLNS